MSNNIVTRLFSEGEGQTLEYKLTLPSIDSLARSIAAFANSGGGTIVIGIDDMAHLIGVSDTIIENAPAAIEQATKLLNPEPQLTYYVEEIQGKKLFVIDVQKYPTPILTEKGRFYVRSGNLNMTGDENLINSLANAVPTIKPNILSSLGATKANKETTEDIQQFNKVVHKKMEEENNLNLGEVLSVPIQKTREELLAQRQERRHQAHVAFWFSLICLIITVLLIFVGIVCMYFGKIQAGVLSSIASIGSGIVDGIIFTFYKQTNDRLDGTAKELLTLEKANTAMEFISLMQDVKLRDETIRDLSKSLYDEKK